jgi:hypothetical protein
MKQACDEACMAYFYCDFRRPEFQDPVNVVGSLVAQLCSQLGYFPDKLETAFAHCSSGGQKRRSTLPLLMEVLAILAVERKVILLVDAIDECNKRGDFFGAISNLEKEDGISMLITSRAEMEIQDALFFFKNLRIESNLQEVGYDISQYIDHRLVSDRKLLWLNPSIRTDIRDLLNSRSHGM